MKIFDIIGFIGLGGLYLMAGTMILALPVTFMCLSAQIYGWTNTLIVTGICVFMLGAFVTALIRFDMDDGGCGGGIDG